MQTDFVESHAAKFLDPLFDSNFRWAYQHDVCRDDAFAVLCAHPSSGVHLPPYVVLEILEWANAEYVLRSTHKQRIDLIVGVAASVRRIHAARTARGASSRNE